MVSEHILDYLTQNAIDVEWLEHERAVSSSRLARVLHVRGRQLAKPVICKADGVFVMCLIPGSAELDVDLVADALGAEEARLAEESEFRRFFPDCEAGSEPPFGGLYQLPLLMDGALAEQETIVFRAGSHVDALEMRVEEFLLLESPQIEPLTSQSAPANPGPTREEVYFHPT